MRYCTTSLDTNPFSASQTDRVSPVPGYSPAWGSSRASAASNRRVGKESPARPGVAFVCQRVNLQAVIEAPPIEQIASRIVEALHPRRIVLFGSRARGQHRPDSDVDLMVEMETPLRPAERMRQVYALFGSRHWSMDVIVYTPQEVAEHSAYRNSLLRVIESEGKVLYEQPR